MSARPPDARSLFAAAREDGPGARQRDAVFRGVALATGISSGVALAATAVAATPAVASGVGTGAKASAFSIKVLATGGLIGAVSTALGVLLAVTFLMPEALSRPAAGAAPLHPPADASSPAVRTRAVAPGAKLAAPRARGRDTTEADATAKAIMEAKALAASAKAEASARVDAPSDLAEEARLVTEARTALVAGDSARALALVQATRKLGARALEPEELGLEARALRALGRADEAAATELVLRRRHPESALAR